MPLSLARQKTSLCAQPLNGTILHRDPDPEAELNVLLLHSIAKRCATAMDYRQPHGTTGPFQGNVRYKHPRELVRKDYRCICRRILCSFRHKYLTKQMRRCALIKSSCMLTHSSPCVDRHAVYCAEVYPHTPHQEAIASMNPTTLWFGEASTGNQITADGLQAKQENSINFETHATS